ncbi:MAG TPA: penicillin-insensitive murein endopeptidase [Kofleriaceae bacterium]
MLVLVAATVATTASADSHHRHAKKHVAHARDRVEIRGPVRGQSVGAPWNGYLRDAARLPDGDGYVIRRPWRAFGTRTTVDYVLRAITDLRERFPDAHVFAIGDLSAEHGGPITEHRSHQTGRDADIGLVYKDKPANFPRDFVHASESNLDAAATFALVREFAETAHDDGGVQMMFLDFEVQGILYRWGKAHGIDEDRLDYLFQYPHGRGSSDGLVRHEPNHDNHLHVRFKCPRGDSACR